MTKPAKMVWYEEFEIATLGDLKHALDVIARSTDLVGVEAKPSHNLKVTRCAETGAVLDVVLNPDVGD